jgi:hypothetical protein
VKIAGHNIDNDVADSQLSFIETLKLIQAHHQHCVGSSNMHLPSLVCRVRAEGRCVDPGGWALSDRLAGRVSAVAGVLSLGAAKEVGGGRAIDTNDGGVDLLDISIGQEERNGGGLSGQSAASQGEKSE